MAPEVRAAVWEWASGFIIGLLPLLAHAGLYPIVDPPADFNELWSPDVLFIAIGNSGLSALTAFTRLANGSVQKLDAATGFLMSLTLLTLVLACMTYGTTVNGKLNHLTIYMTFAYLVISAICSLFFEIAIAGRTKPTH